MENRLRGTQAEGGKVSEEMCASVEEAPKTSQRDCPSLCSRGPTSYWKGTRAGPPWCFPRGLPGRPARRTEIISRATPETLNDLNIANLECEISFSLVLPLVGWEGRRMEESQAGAGEGRMGSDIAWAPLTGLPHTPQPARGGLLAAQVTSSVACCVHGSALDDTSPCFYQPGAS